MSTSTKSLALTKAGTSEAYDVGIVNANLELVDVAVGPSAGSIASSTLASTTGEATIETFTVPADVGIVGRVFQVIAAGQAGVTGTPTLTFRLRVGGITGVTIATVVVTAASGVTGKSWKAIGEVAVLTAGTVGTWIGSLAVINELNTVLPSASDVVCSTTGQAKDTTVTQTVVLTAQWGTANAANTLTKYYGYGRQVA